MSTELRRPKSFTDVLKALENDGCRLEKVGRGYSTECQLHGHPTKEGHIHVEDAGDKALASHFPPIDQFYKEFCEHYGYDTLSYSRNGRKPGRVYGDIVATYPYQDAAGKGIYEVVRYANPKGFSQRRPDPNRPGEYIYNLHGIRPVLFDLPKVLEAVKVGRPLVIVEGEKDKLNLQAFDPEHKQVTVTNNPMGALKWREYYTEALKEAVGVCILADNDNDGRKHAQQVAASLHKAGIPVKVLDMPKPEIKDASDWIEAGLTLDQLLAAFDAAPPWEPPTGTATNTGPFPVIKINDRQLRDITADALEALYESNDPPHTFRRSGALTRIGRDEKGLPFAETMNESALRGKLARAANFVRVTEKGGEIAVAPTLEVTRDVGSLGEWDFPALAGIIEAPALRPDGTVLTEPGYDRSTGLYYVPAAGLKLPPIGDDLDAAVDLIKEVFCDFPFDSEASRANAYGALLSPIARAAIKGPSPMPLIDKPGAGAGASLMADTISITSTGHLAATMGVPGSEDEWEKKLSSHLLAGRSLCVIDNIEGNLWSDTLSRYLTSSYVSIRPLGRSADIVLANNMTVIATGNNMRLGWA